MAISVWMWAGFAVLVAAVLYIDLGLLNRKAHSPSIKEAASWCAAWVALACLFGAWIYFKLGPSKAAEFFTGYVIEYSLSVDNLFVFIVIFDYFAVPRQDQPRVLHWGILGTVAMRLVFILAGVKLLEAFHWMIYVFSAVLLFTGVKLLFAEDEKIDPSNNPMLKLFKRWVPLSDRYHGESFFFRDKGLLYATPLFATLLVVEGSDLVFTLDSIPAVLAITTDPFIVYTSNVFAVLGLRSLFFVVSGVLGLFRFLKTGISLILCFVGVKMLLSDWYHIPTSASLAVVGAVLAISIAASALIKQEPEKP